MWGKISMDNPLPVIDWKVFAGLPENNITCGCVFARLKDGDTIPTFRSHAKYIKGCGIITQKPCPDCGKNDNVHSAASDWSSW